MAVLVSARAQSTYRELIDRLKVRLASAMPVLAESNATDGSPIAIFSADSSPAAGEKIVVVKVTMIAAPLNYDVFGNAGTVYGPHVVQICTEKNFAGTTDNVADILVAQDLLNVIAECVRSGCIVEWYQTNNATAPTAAGITGTPAATFKPLHWPLAGQ